MVCRRGSRRQHFGSAFRVALLLCVGLVLTACGSGHDVPINAPEPAPYSALPARDGAGPSDPRGNFEPLFADKVVVVKSERKLLLLADGRPFRDYTVSLGFAPVGPKKSEGDGRTPEGLYRLDWKNPNSEFYRSIHISYPNARDRARAEAAGVDPGDNIMIHGLGPEMGFLGKTHRAADWTNGCIAVTDREIDEIWRLVRPGTPIEIRP